MKLGARKIVSEALLLIDAEGLDALNMRALAARLGVGASALYWHVESREKLITLIAGELYQRAFEQVPPDLPWREWLMAFGMEFREALRKHRDSARLCALARPDPVDGDESTTRLAAPLVAAGLTKRQALTCQSSVIALALGWVVYEQSSGMHDHLDQLVGIDRSFRIGLTALVSGFPD